MGNGVHDSCEVMLMEKNAAIARLEAELTACRGDGFAANPGKWSHVDQIAGLTQHVVTLQEEVARLTVDRDQALNSARVHEARWSVTAQDNARLRLALTAAADALQYVERTIYIGQANVHTVSYAATACDAAREAAKEDA